jgi:high-affinity Fe2+/Pb2+ permease
MTFASFVNVLIWYINSLFIPFVFALAFLAFLWGVFMYMFYYEQNLEKARNIILGGVVTLAIMVSLWGILAVIRNSLTDTKSYHYDPFSTVWDDWFGGRIDRATGSLENDMSGFETGDFLGGDTGDANSDAEFGNSVYPNSAGDGASGEDTAEGFFGESDFPN